MIKVILIATSDLVTDQRIHRTATTLQEEGYHVVAIGRRLPNTPKTFESPYRIKHLRIPFLKGFLFYSFFNLFAFIFLIFSRFQILQANDLDTLLAARLACYIKRKPLVYDSHELFTEVPELVNRPCVKKFWGWLEERLVKGLKHCSTVSQGVAHELRTRYGIHFRVIRNLPKEKNTPDCYQTELRTIIYQGALNIGRGIEKLIASMQFIPNSNLIIAGTGDIDDELRALTKKLRIEDRVTFTGRIPHGDLHLLTCKATIGVSLEEDMSLNYRYALPNKLFDYIQAGLPVVVSNLPEMLKIVEQYEVGITVPSNCNANTLAEQLNDVLSNKQRLAHWHNNAQEASKELAWESEKNMLINLFRGAEVELRK